MELLKVIKYEGDEDTLIWKHPNEDFNTQSKLIVHESQEAILFRDGQALDTFGPGKYTLETENIPLLRSIINIPTEGVSPFHCEVYFINKSASLNMEWGTSSRFQVLDPTFGVPLSVGASGSMEFLVEDSRKFLIKVVGTQKLITADDVVRYFKEKTVTKVKTSLARIMSEVSYLNITQHLEDISEAIQNKLQDDYLVYGIKLLNFYVSTIVIPEEDTNKVKEVLNKKMEYGTLDFNWADEQIADISKKYASNPGSQDNVGGMMAQIPIAMAFGEMLKNNIVGSAKNPFTAKAMAFGGANSSSNNNHSKTNNNIFCPNCGEELNANAHFCINCGEKIENDLKCPQCGVNIKPNTNFCMNCGNKLK